MSDDSRAARPSLLHALAAPESGPTSTSTSSRSSRSSRDRKRPEARPAARPAAPLEPDPALDPGGGGLLVVGGPPLGGKSVLATALAQLLPRSVALIAIDSVAGSREKWYVHGPTSQPVERPAAKMLSAAQSIWWDHLETRRPTIVMSARFETPFMRRRAQMVAERVLRTRRFLFVEARSGGVATVHGLAARVLPTAQLRKRVASYRTVCERYQEIGHSEASNLSCLRLRRVRSDLVAALDRVLIAWAATG